MTDPQRGRPTAHRHRSSGRRRLPAQLGYDCWKTQVSRPGQSKIRRLAANAAKSSQATNHYSRPDICLPYWREL